MCEYTSSNKVDEYTSRTIVLDRVRYAVAVRKHLEQWKHSEKYLNYASRHHGQQFFLKSYTVL